MTENLQTVPDLIPVSKFNDYYAYPTVGSLRQLIYYNPDDFLNTVVRRIGKRLYIKTSSFFKWVEETNRKEAKIG